MIETLIRTLGLRVGRFTSPHLESMTERISIDGEPLSEEEFVRAFNDVAPYLELVDADQDHPLSFFETVVAMAYAAFAEAPVDAAVVEVGMGGAWDATNVIDAKVAVLTPIAVDHAKYLGDTPAVIAAGEGRDHQARRHRRHRRAERRGGPGARRAVRRGRRDAGPRGPRVRRDQPRARRGRPADRPAGAARQLRGGLPAAVRRPPGPERRARARGRRGVRRGQRTPSTPTWWPRRSPRSPRPVGWRSSGPRRRSCSTPRTTPTAPPPWSPRWRTASPSGPWWGWSA